MLAGIRILATDLPNTLMTIFPPPHTFRPYLLSVLLLVAAIGSRYVLAPRILTWPDDFGYTAQIISRDNFYDELAQRFRGEFQSDTRLAYDVVARERGVMIVRNAFEVRSQDGEQVFSVERQYGVDPLSGRHVPGHGDKDREGFLFAPRFLAKQDVTYWHVSYDTPVQLRFQDEEMVEGLRLYRYASTFYADQTDNLQHLPFVGTARGVNLDVHLQVWFEPVSGRMVKYADQATAYFYELSTGKRLYPWNRFSNVFSEKSIQEQVRLAAAEKSRAQVFALYIPVFLLILALVWATLAAARTMRWKLVLNRRVAVVVALTLLSCGATLVRWGYLSVERDSELAARFSADTATLVDMVSGRMDSQVGLLEAARGLFEAMGPVNASQWKAYVGSLGLAARYPGLQGVGFAPLVRSEDEASFRARMGAETSSSYEIFPPGNRSEYVPIAYLEPSDERNRRAVGYDMFSEAVRREALMAARDSGMPALSGKVTLVQETEPDRAQAGVLLYVPVYRPGATVDTAIQRREALLGYVYSPFRMENLMNTLLSGKELGIDMEIYDGTEENAANPVQRMYSSLPRTRRAAPPLMTATRTVSVVGRPWTFRFSTMPGYSLGNYKERMPTVVLIVGLAFTVLMVLGMRAVCRWSVPAPAERSPFVKRSPYKDIL